MNIIIAQIFKLIGIFFCISSNRTTENKKIFIYNGLDNFFCMIQYFLLGACTGGIVCGLTILRNILFYRFKKPPIIILILFLMCVYICNFFVLSKWYTYLPMAMGTFYSIALYTKNIKNIKYASIITCSIEIIYDYNVKAYLGMILCVVSIIFAIISLKKLDKKKVHKKRR